MAPISHKLPRGVASILQTPFTTAGAVDADGLLNLIESALRGGVSGFLAPAVASEVEFLSRAEREEIIRLVAKTVAGRVPFIVGASSDDPEDCRNFARLAEQVGAAAYVVAVPQPLFAHLEELPGFFCSIAEGCELPLVIQDLQWNGPGLSVATLIRLKEQLPTLVGVKIETMPAGPKYTAVRRALGKDFFIGAGWAIPQMIEALDRGVDALMPESSIVAVYSAIVRAHTDGDRPKALQLFRRLIPLPTFTNQEIGVSIAFFKRLLVRKGIFRTAVMRRPWAGWDEFNSRIADELIELYLALEAELGGDSLTMRSDSAKVNQGRQRLGRDF